MNKPATYVALDVLEGALEHLSARPYDYGKDIIANWVDDYKSSIHPCNDCIHFNGVRWGCELGIISPDLCEQ